MQNERVIGGEFECSPINASTESLFVLNSFAYTYSSGRSALYHILLSCRQQYASTLVYLPDYLCSTIIYAAEKAGFKYEFYRIDTNLKPRFDDIKGLLQNSTLLLIDYFGIVDNEPLIRELKNKRPDIIVVKDLVQAPYNLSEESIADYQFTSFRKAFPVPDGSWVVTKHSMGQPGKTSRFSQYKLAASLLKSNRSLTYYDDKLYLEMYEKGESMIDDDIEDYDMCPMTRSNLHKMPFRQYADIRKKNASVILKGIKEIGIDTIVPVTTESVPLFVPIWLENRNCVRKAMFANNIFLPVHWPIEKCREQLKSGNEYADHQLSIIIDQRYNEQDMMRILDILDKSIK